MFCFCNISFLIVPTLSHTCEQKCYTDREFVLLFYEVGIPLPMGGVERGGSKILLSFTDMAAISGSWVSYIFTSRANLSTPKKKNKAKQFLITTTDYFTCLFVSGVCRIFNRTFSLVVEPICFDDLLLDLGGHGQHKLQHLAHVIAGALSGFLHAGCVLRHGKGLDHLTQNNWNAWDNSVYELWLCCGSWACKDWSLTSGLLYSESGLLCWGRGHAGLRHSRDLLQMSEAATVNIKTSHSHHHMIRSYHQSENFWQVW